MTLFHDLLAGKAPTVTGVFLCQDVVNMEAVSMPLNATVRLGGLELIVILVTLMVFFLILKCFRHDFRVISYYYTQVTRLRVF